MGYPHWGFSFFVTYIQTYTQLLLYINHIRHHHHHHQNHHHPHLCSVPLFQSGRGTIFGVNWDYLGVAAWSISLVGKWEHFRYNFSLCPPTYPLTHPTFKLSRQRGLLNISTFTFISTIHTIMVTFSKGNTIIRIRIIRMIRPS